MRRPARDHRPLAAWTHCHAAVEKRKLGRDTGSDGVVVEGDVFAELEPAALAFRSLCHAVDFAGGVILPRFITRDRKITPRAPFQVLHQDRADGEVIRGGWGLTQEFFE